jgi:predicted transcriptional regulator of viral defense system
VEDSHPRLTRILEAAQESGLLRSRDLDRYGIARQYLRIAEQQGLVTRVGRGIYAPADQRPSEFRSFEEVAKRVPRGIICLLSALRFHDLTTQAPFEVWIALDRKSRTPRLEYPPIRVIRMTPVSLEYGIQRITSSGVEMKVSSAAKTVADCFKYRNRIGLDVALEALRDTLRKRKASVDELWTAGRVCRVLNIMRPYIEALV